MNRFLVTGAENIQNSTTKTICTHVTVLLDARFLIHVWISSRSKFLGRVRVIAIIYIVRC